MGRSTLNKDKLIYAIDFGTSNSLLAAADDQNVDEPLELDSLAEKMGADPSVFRSILFFPTQDQCFYGRKAIQEYINNDMQGRLIRSIKRFLPVRSFVGTWIENRPMNLEDIIGLFLSQMRQLANKYYDADVTKVVLGRPARYSEDDATDEFAQYRMERAARNAGFKEIRFLEEPKAAAFSFRKLLKDQNTILVADYGGGTSDYTVMKMNEDPSTPTEVLSLTGVSVAGDALDSSIMRNKISSHFGADVQYKAPFGNNVLTMPKDVIKKICTPAEISLLRAQDIFAFLKEVKSWSLGDDDQAKMDHLFTLIEDQIGFQVFESIEKCKRDLSDSEEALFQFEYPSLRIEERIKRTQFEDWATSELASINDALDEAIANANVSPDQIDFVCCTGGTAQVPAIRQELEKRFDPKKLVKFDNYHGVIRGLAESARAWAKEG